MKRSNKKSMLVIMIIATFLLAGCNKFSLDFFQGTEDNSSGSKASPTEIAADKDADKEELDNKEESSKSSMLASEDGKEDNNASSSDDSTPTPAPIQPTENIDLPIYVVNSETAEIEPVTAVLPKDSDITPNLIVSQVIEAMADQEIILATDQVTTNGKTVIVSFERDKSPASDMGSGYEIAILDAIYLSLIDNLKDYNKVIYRLEGEAYQSGHIELGIDEGYLGNN